MAEQQKRLKSLAACVDQTRRQAKHSAGYYEYVDHHKSW